MKKIIFILFTVWAAGAAADTTDYQQAMDQWQGASTQALFQVWGYPDGKIKLPGSDDGKPGKKSAKNVVYSYKKCRQINTTANMGFNNSPFTNQNQATTVCCSTKFLVKNNKVTEVQFDGEGCEVDKTNQWQPDE